MGAKCSAFAFNGAVNLSRATTFVKLIYCPPCQDVVRLYPRKPRACACGAAFGAYADHLHAYVGGTAIPLGFDNASLQAALRSRPRDGDGSRFTAFVIPQICGTVERVDSMSELNLVI